MRLGVATAVGIAALVTPLSATPAIAARPHVAGPLPVAQPAVPQPADPSTPGLPPPGVVFVEVSPSLVQPGYLVGIRASCHDNSWPATVWSDAFGKVTVHPQNGVLTASPMVSTRTRPGNYRVKLECRTGETATTTLQVVKKHPPTPPPTHRPTHRPSHGPATGFGGTAGPSAGDLLVPGGLALTLAGMVAGVLTLRRQRRASRWWGPS
ncbi:hypothetical protein ABT336_25755 [Micromonospora sp. NPDC000207]|uniref:hypothetical protein n=1 Tax=Micromonospora sp. NPDC000207 TaxID=3154246 RepID=UPI0033235E72